MKHRKLIYFMANQQISKTLLNATLSWFSFNFWNQFLFCTIFLQHSYVNKTECTQLPLQISLWVFLQPIYRYADYITILDDEKNSNEITTVCHSTWQRAAITYHANHLAGTSRSTTATSTKMSPQNINALS